ncbi:hypothetical protein [Halomonas sp. E19]|uniref:hypothetical protein n=1 Tax=Halomonas sp. E19 TaxID=3397247 RepID=UPI00403475A6
MSQSFPAWDSAKIYLNHGLIKLGRGKAADYDELARRAQYWSRVQRRLGGDDLGEYLMANAITDAEHKRLLEALAPAQAEEPQGGQVYDLFA